MKKILSIIAVTILIGCYSFSAQAQMSGLWKIISGTMSPVVSTWELYSPDDFRFDDEIKPDGDLCSNGQILKKTGADNWDCVADETGAGGSGSMTTVKENGVQLGGADIVTLDFLGADFNLTETPDTEVNITINDGGIDHGALAGLSDDDHTQYTLANGTREFTGAQTFNENIEMSDDKKLYFDDAKTYYAEYDWTEDVFRIRSDPGVDEVMELVFSDNDGLILDVWNAISNTVNIRATNGDYMDYFAKLSTNNLTNADRAFEFPDAAGTFITSGNLSDITTVGTIGTGVWNGTALTSTYIGSNQILESHLKAVNAPTDEYVLTYESTTGDFEWQSVAGGGDIADVFDCTTGDCNTITVGTSEWLAYGTGYIDANRFAGVTTVDATEFGYLNGLTAAIVQAGSASHDGFSDYVANEHLDWTQDLGATNIHAGNYTAGLTNLTDFDQTAWRLFYSNNLGDVIELSLGTDGEYLQSQGGTSSLTWSTPTDTNTNANTICAGSTTYLDGEGNCDDISSVYEGTLTNSAGLLAALNDETGTGVSVFSTSPTFITPLLGTPTSGVLTNCTGTASGLTAGNVTTNANLTGDITSVGNATTITADVITHADIADSDQTDTKCFYLEDPTADDDLKSIWRNSTANNFLLTEIWGESDQTVSFDLQVDDGTPADVSGTDIAPAAGEAEDTTLAGDTTLAASEELDLIITSVSGTPTWVSICFTGNWVD